MVTLDILETLLVTVDILETLLVTLDILETLLVTLRLPFSWPPLGNTSVWPGILPADWFGADRHSTVTTLHFS